jgi:hypothetical protein
MMLDARQMVMYGSTEVDEEIKAIILQVYMSAAKLSIEPMILIDTAREAIRIEENNVYPLPFKY